MKTILICANRKLRLWNVSGRLYGREFKVKFFNTKNSGRKILIKPSTNGHTCHTVGLNTLEILLFGTLRSHRSKPLPPTARILSYLSSAQQDLTGEPHENIRKPIIATFTVNSST